MTRIGVVGGGVAGLTAAYVASRTATVTLFEADARLGGHADTHLVPTPAGPVAVDTGFIVHNARTYPTLMRLFAELGVPTQDSEMSLSFRSDAVGLEYAGARGLRGLFPSWRNLARPSYLRMLAEIPRFHRRARALLQEQAERESTPDLTLGAFLDRGGFSATFRRHFVRPLVAAVWSCDDALALEYPARYLFEFLTHHGMLRVFGSPRWRTVTGGSRVYVDRLAAAVRASGGRILLDTKVTSVAETAGGVEVTDGNGAVHRFDAIVLAAHPGQALAMLADPTPAQREVLGAMPYSPNVALLHTDTRLLPHHRRARASWNHLERPDRDGTHGVTVTYDLTRLMRLPEQPDGRRFLVSLGAEDLVDPAQVIARRDYEHPLYTPASVAARARAADLDSDRLAFAGAWRGWGFHEDGARSGLAAVERLGLSWPRASRPACGAVTGVYATTIRHTRRTPLRARFEHRSHAWLVDLDDLPDHGRWARFEARDHVGDPGRTIRDNLDRFLASHGVDLEGGQVLMLTLPRALGHCFNPITVFWCFRPGAPDPAATVVEVHNTYGDRHAYLVRPDADGRARTAKAMYVSPFHGTDGHYELTVPAPTVRDGRGEVRVSVRLVTADGATFDASLRGRRVGDADRPHRRAALAAWRTSALIRVHGIALWVRRLPVRPRPHHHQEGVR